MTKFISWDKSEVANPNLAYTSDYFAEPRVKLNEDIEEMVLALMAGGISMDRITINPARVQISGMTGTIYSTVCVSSLNAQETKASSVLSSF